MSESVRPNPYSTLRGGGGDLPVARSVQTACPPREEPAASHCATSRAPEGNSTDGRKSIRNDTSCALPVKVAYMSTLSEKIQRSQVNQDR